MDKVDTSAEAVESNICNVMINQVGFGDYPDEKDAALLIGTARALVAERDALKAEVDKCHELHNQQVEVIDNWTNTSAAQYQEIEELKAYISTLEDQASEATGDMMEAEGTASTQVVAVMTLQSQNKALHDELIDAKVENDRLREALEPFAFLDSETTQEAWEIRYNDRLKDWISFDEIENARAALKAT